MSAPEPVRRDDGELIGVLDHSDEGWTPCTVCGAPLGDPTDRASAEATLHATGMSYLAGRCLLREGEDWITVEIVEASPEQVTLRLVDYDYPGIYGQRRVRSTPVGDSLRMP